MVKGIFAGKLALFRSALERARQEYADGYQDGKDGGDPQHQGVEYIDGWLDGYEGRRALPPLL